MARSIVLRFDATCFDCGALLSAGTTARWFGRGRVSCCGARVDGAAAGAPPAAASVRPLSPPIMPELAPGARHPADDAEARRILEAQRGAADSPAAADDPALQRAMVEGLSPGQVNQLADRFPRLKLLVRLASGARFIVEARDAAHVVRCVLESMVDKVRDVTRAVQQ